MLLTEKDREYLRKECNESERDIEQIEAAINYTNFTRNGKFISVNNVIRLLGKNRFLQGMRRSAFHRDCNVFIGDTDDTVYFDSSKFFKGVNA